LEKTNPSLTESGIKSEPKIDFTDLNVLKKLTAKDLAELALRLENDDYPNAFASLNDWHVLRAVAFNIPEMAEPYMYLLDLEAFDEC
jgi:Protein of unknown function (DUF2555)